LHSCTALNIPFFPFTSKEEFHHVANKQMFPSGVKFVMKIFLAFVLYDNIKAVSMEFERSRPTIIWIPLGEIDDTALQEELQACQHFTADFELEKGKLRVSTFTKSTFNSGLFD